MLRRSAIYLSGLLHLALITLVFVGLPTSSNPFEAGSPVAVPIVFSDISDTINQQAGAAQVTEQAPKDVAAPPEKPETRAETPPAPEPEPTPPQPEVAEPTPPPPAPEPAPTPPQVAEPAPPEPTPPEPQVAEPTPPEPPAPQPEVAAPAPEPEPQPAPPEPQPEQVASAPPPPPEPEVKPEPKPEPEPQPPAAVEEPAPQQTAVAPPDKPQRKVTLPQPEPPKQQEAKKEENRLDAILKDVTKREDQPAQTSQPSQQQQASASQSTPQTSSTRGTKVSGPVQDAIGQQVARCWNVDVGAKDIESMVVEIRAYMRRDGYVDRAEILDTGRYQSDARFRAAADAALRAVRNPRCQPFSMLPAAYGNDYDEWSVIVFNFDPKVMF